MILRFARDKRRTGWGYRTHSPAFIYILMVQHESRRMSLYTRNESVPDSAALRPASRRTRRNQGTALRAEYESQVKSKIVQVIDGEWGGQVGKVTIKEKYASVS
jgi:hypothetical protein